MKPVESVGIGCCTTTKVCKQFERILYDAMETLKARDWLPYGEFIQNGAPVDYAREHITAKA